MVKIAFRGTKQRLLLLSAGITTLVAGLVVPPPTVSAAPPIIACRGWRTASWGQARQCATDQMGTEAVQYTDYGAADGHCVRPRVWSTSSNNWVEFGAPNDCTTTGVTTVYSTAADKGVRLYRTDFGAYITVCDGVNPGTDADWCLGW